MQTQVEGADGEEISALIWVQNPGPTAATLCEWKFYTCALILPHLSIFFLLFLLLDEYFKGLCAYGCHINQCLYFDLCNPVTHLW